MTVNRRAFATLCAATLAAPMFGCASSAPAAKTRSWETMDRATLDRAYNNSAAVPESGAMFKEWIGRSEKLRAQHPEHLNLAYGPRPRDRIDYFSAGNGTPVLIMSSSGARQTSTVNQGMDSMSPFLAASSSPTRSLIRRSRITSPDP